MSEQSHKISFDAIRKKDIGKVPAPSTVSPPIHKRTVKDGSGYNTQLKQQKKTKRWYYLAAHHHIVNVWPNEN